MYYRLSRRAGMVSRRRRPPLCLLAYVLRTSACAAGEAFAAENLSPGARFSRPGLPALGGAAAAPGPRVLRRRAGVPHGSPGRAADRLIARRRDRGGGGPPAL